MNRFPSMPRGGSNIVQAIVDKETLLRVAIRVKLTLFVEIRVRLPRLDLVRQDQFCEIRKRILESRHEIFGVQLVRIARQHQLVVRRQPRDLGEDRRIRREDIAKHTSEEFRFALQSGFGVDLPDESVSGKPAALVFIESRRFVKNIVKKLFRQSFAFGQVAYSPSVIEIRKDIAEIEKDR